MKTNTKCFLEPYRSGRSQMFFKIGVVKNFAIVTGNHLRWSLFLIRLQTFRSAILLKRLQHSCFPAKFLGTLFYRTPPVAASEF